MLIFLDDHYMFQDLQSQFSILQTIIHDLLWITGPFLIHFLGIYVMFLSTQQLLGNGIERLLTRADLTLDVPPRIYHNSSLDFPEPLELLLHLRTVSTDLQLESIDFCPFLEERQIITINVVSGYNVGIMV